MMRIALLSSVMAAVVGCGKKDDGKAPPAKGAEPSGQAAKVEPATVADPAKQPAAPAPVANNLGTCKLEITGAATATIEASGGMSAASTSYWFAPDDKQRNMLYPDGDKQPGVILNCVGTGATLNILARDTTPEILPFGPKKYTLGGSEGGLSVMGSIGKGSIMGGKGTIDVTAFDKTHIAAKIDLTAKLLGPDGNGEIKIVGELDYKCPGLSGCTP